MNPWYQIENADAVFSPALLVYPDRIRRNLEQMIRWVGEDRADRLRPHVKTHKLPQIVRMKLEAGITKFKTSTIAEAEMTAEAGGKDILIAYQPVGPNIARFCRLVEAFPDVRFSAIVDDPDVARSIAAEAKLRDIVAEVYIDLNVGMNRTGILPDERAESLYRWLHDAPELRAAGFHAYDGHLHDTDEEELRRQATEAFAPVWALKQKLEADGVAVPAVVGCGTPTSFLMAEHDIEVSAGTSVLWDAGQPTFTPAMEILPAAVLLARVISRPTEDTICVDVGHKAVASEMEPPRIVFLGLEEATAVMHSEEHLVLRGEQVRAFPVGTVLYGIPFHICPTVALHNEVWCVENRRAKEKWPVVARSRCLSI